MTYVKAPIKKTLMRMALFFFGKRTLNKSGIGMLRMITSEDMLKTALVIRWFVAAEHCSTLVNNELPTCAIEQATYSSLEALPNTGRSGDTKHPSRESP
jgi:hypothetical protein